MPGLMQGAAAALQAPLWLHSRGLRHLSAPAARVRPDYQPLQPLA